MLTSTHWGVYDVETENGRVVRMRPFAHDPEPSLIGQGMPSVVDGPTRIRRPAVRRGWLERGPGAATDRRGAEPFVEVSWDEAVALVAGEVDRVRKAHGNPSIFAGSYGWSSAGRFHHAQSQVHRFMNAAGGYTYHASTYSLGAARVLMQRLVAPMDELRAQHTAWPVIAQHCTLFVAFGGVPTKNAQVNAGGASQHEVGGHLRRLSAAGIPFVNVSPVFQDLAEARGAQWIPIRPNTDTAFMLGLAHTLAAEGLHDRAFLDRCCTGFDRFRHYLEGGTDGVAKDARWAATICGVDADTIVGLARRMAASRTMLNVSWSLQRADHGEQPYWMVVTLAAMLGQIGLPGGGFALGYGAVNAEGTHAATFSGPVLPQGRNAVASFIPVARITDMLEHPGGTFDFDGRALTYPDIRLIYWAGGNPFHHHQDLNRMLRAWRKPETIVVHEQYWNAHAKHADIVLPATTSLERDDIGSAGRDRFMIAMKRAIAPVGEARDDYDIFAAVAAKLGPDVHATFTEGRTAAAWLRHMYDAAAVKAKAGGIDLPGFEAFWAEGQFGIPEPEKPMVLLEAFRADPVAHPLRTPSGRIEIFSETIAGFGYDDAPGHPVWREPAEWLGGAAAQRFPLHLLSNQPATKLHSQYDQGPVSQAAKVASREAIAMHPDDAAARGLAAGDVVRVFNDRGQCLAGVRVEPGLRPGVVVMATGSWYDPLVPGEPGTLEKNGNPNVLTLDKGTSRLTQGCIAQTCLVEVERFAGPVPPITAYDPPVLLRRS
jgi:biotin/methionine sulfoxide reductase